MRPALPLFCYALAVAWLPAAALARLTSRGVSAPLGLAAWLSAMGSALAAAGRHGNSYSERRSADWPGLTRALCRSVAGNACTPSCTAARFEPGAGRPSRSVTLPPPPSRWRYGRRVQRAGRRSRSTRGSRASPAGACPAPARPRAR